MIITPGNVGIEEFIDRRIALVMARMHKRLTGRLRLFWRVCYHFDSLRIKRKCAKRVYEEG